MWNLIRPGAQGLIGTVLCLGCICSTVFAGGNRPQTPTPPFPYISEEVTFASSNGESTLAGTLALPKTGGPFPAVYLIPGGAPFDRDETLAGHKPFLVLADHLVRKGFAVLRVDDRGVGKSTGSKFAVTLSDLAGDVVTGVSFLRAQPNIDPRRVGIIGHSLGAIIAPIAAVESEGVGFLVLLGGTGEMWMDYLASSYALHDGKGTVEVNRKLSAVMNKMLWAKDGDTVRMKDVREKWEAFVPTLSTGEQTHARSFIGAVKDIDTFLAVRPFHDLLAHDSAATLSRVKCPVLALTGGRDPMALTLPSIGATLKAGGNSDFTIRELPNLNHMLQTVDSKDYEDGPAQWRQIEETMSPVALDAISTWLTDQFIEK